MYGMCVLFSIHLLSTISESDPIYFFLFRSIILLYAAGFLKAVI